MLKNELDSWFDTQCKELRKTANMLCEEAYFKIGMRVKNTHGYYKITKVTFSFSNFNTGGYIGIHGFKMLKNREYGNHVHYIGSPEDITIVCEDY